jgi:polysaccharide biosynthesis transport protein
MNEIVSPAPQVAPVPARFDRSPLVGFGIAPAAVAAASSPQAPLNAIVLLKAFRRCWRVAVGLGLVGAVIAATAVWLFLPPTKYIVESLLLVEPVQPRLIVATKEYRSDPETDRKTQVALIKSLVVSKVGSQPEVTRLEIIRKQSDPATWLESEIKAEFTGTILRLALSCNTPVEAATLIKAVTDTYISEVANKEKVQRLERNRTLEDHYGKLQKQLESKRNQLRALSTALGSKDKQALSMQQRLAINRQNMVEEELLHTQSELRHAMAEVKVLQDKGQTTAEVNPALPSSPLENADIELTIQRNPLVQEYVHDEERLIGIIKRANIIARSQADPATMNAKRELTRIQKLKKELVEQLRAEALARGGDSTEVGGQPEDGRRPESSLATLKNQIEVLARLERELQDEVGKVAGDTKKLDSKALEVESIQDEVKSAEGLAKLIADELEVLKIELNAPDRVSLIKEARVPPIQDKTRKIQVAGMAGGGVFGAVVLLLSFLEFRTQRISSTDEVIGGLGIKVVGTVPVIRGGARRSHSSTSGSQDRLWEHQLTESVDTTRIMLTRTAGAESLRVILVTSAIGGEGKTSLSTYLAASLARSGQKTLLVDGDLRRPMVHRVYDQPNSPGFCELIRDECAVEDVIRPASTTNLWILTAGVQDDQTTSLLGQPGVRNLFNQLREQFDFIIVDSAPVLPVADTLLLTQLVDAALFSILSDVSQFPQIQAAYGRIAALGVPMLGAVLSGTHVNKTYRY